MKSIKTEITINATPAVIWSILMDHKQYAEWNPFITKIEGDSNVGGSLSILIQLNEKKESTFTPTVLKNEKETEFRWVGRLFVKGLFDGEHYFKLQPQPDGSTKFIHGENFTGVMSSFIMNMIEDDTLKGFAAMNQALKAEAEKA